ncbi:formate dehydrogenase subunit delta [Cryptosporangium sp. NPDC051539]|uniref:formate dehydrogenase subunit delta n=1 Tax=Cryptosporangium sp. NPDC051539 TaxID=3363962 RepID=UPI0037ADCC8F
MSGVAAEQRMANDIARNFRHLSPDDAVAAIAGHVSRFWDPRMRVRLLALADSGSEGLDPLVTAAAGRLRG